MVKKSMVLMILSFINGVILFYVAIIAFINIFHIITSLNFVSTEMVLYYVGVPIVGGILEIQVGYYILKKNMNSLRYFAVFSGAFGILSIWATIIPGFRLMLLNPTLMRSNLAFSIIFLIVSLIAIIKFIIIFKYRIKLRLEFETYDDVNVSDFLY